MKFISIFIFGALFLPGGLTYADALGNGGVTNLDYHGTCRQISNYTGYTIYIPTNSSAEWNAFINASTPGIGKTYCYANQYTVVTSDTSPVCGYGTNYFEAQTDGSGNIYTRASRTGYSGIDSGWVGGGTALAVSYNGYCAHSNYSIASIENNTLVVRGYFHPSSSCTFVLGTRPNPNQWNQVAGSGFIDGQCPDPPPADSQY